MSVGWLTVSAWLDGRLNVANALYSDAVLVVLVDVRVLEFAHLVQKNAQLVCNVGDVIIASLSPDRKLLLYRYQPSISVDRV